MNHDEAAVSRRAVVPISLLLPSNKDEAQGTLLPLEMPEDI